MRIYYEKIRKRDKNMVKKTKTSKKSTINSYPVSSNPNVAYMPLYSLEKNEKGEMIKVVHKKSGLNWGLQDGHSKKGKGYAEAYIPVTAELIDSHPMVFPCIPDVRMTTTGKVTRKFDPVQVEWDDGTVMEMIFSGTGVERPTKDERNLGDPYKTYPKQFTSGAKTDGGGAELGKYLRQRMNVSARHIITIDDLKNYGRDYIALEYVKDGHYKADFSV